MARPNQLFDRVKQEEFEEEYLSPLGCKSSHTKGRKRKEVPCILRTEFQRDRDRIIHCKSFRRLKHKTQVFITPFGDHYRTRLTHTLEVSQVARTVSRALRLNEDLTEGIALGHDLGHTPFGHIGERTLNQVYSGGFLHNEQSQRVVENLEGNGGLNLTWEVRDGILNHSSEGERILDPDTKTRPGTMEGEVVKIADPIAYVNHDIDDAVRAGLIREEDLSPHPIRVLGRTHRERINTIVRDVVTESQDHSTLRISDEILSAFNQLRDFMYEEIYQSSFLIEEVQKAQRLVKELYFFYLDHPELFPESMKKNLESEGLERVTVDYIAGMTDRYALSIYERYFFPRSWV